jgi:hypothetical protein
MNQQAKAARAARKARSAKPIKRSRPPGSGRKASPVTAEQRITVSTMIACGFPIEDVCAAVAPARGRRVSTQTLYRKFRADMDNARQLLCARVAKRIYDHAMGSGPESLAACKFLMTTLGRWAPAVAKTEIMPGFERAPDINGAEDVTPIPAAARAFPVRTFADFYAGRIADDAIASAAGSSEAQASDPGDGAPA